MLSRTPSTFMAILFVSTLARGAAAQPAPAPPPAAPAPPVGLGTPPPAPATPPAPGRPYAPQQQQPYPAQQPYPQQQYPQYQQQQYPQQQYPQQQYPQQQYPQQQYPQQQYPQQQYPQQQYPQQQYPQQQYPQYPQPYPGQGYPAQPYPGYPYPPSPYGAPPYAYGPPPGHHTHDGFFLRLSLGFGYTSASPEDADASVSGAASTFQIALGGALSRSLVLFGEAVVSTTLEPQVKFAGRRLSDDGVEAGFGGAGPGLVYYVNPLNAFVSASVLFATYKVEANDPFQMIDVEDIHTTTGIGFNVMFGKEWWVSSNWALGAAAQVFGGAAKEKTDFAIQVGNRDTWRSLTFALAFTATYN